MDNDQILRVSSLALIITIIICVNLTGFLIKQKQFMNKKQIYYEIISIFALFIWGLYIWISAHMVIAV